MTTLLAELDQRSSEIRFETIDFSVGELIRLHKDRELIIQPAFQRMFRWTQSQQSRLVESMLLGLPIPQIVLFQRDNGLLELIDGLQRVSSLVRFVTGTTPEEAREEQQSTTELIECDVLPSLNGNTFHQLAQVLQLELKRKTLRAIVIRRTNDPNLRYQMFKRLNSGGSQAEPHEIRNASLRIVGQRGETFLDFLEECSRNTAFQAVTEPLSDQSKRRLGQQELVLRFFALKNAQSLYKGNISSWLDRYSESVAKGELTFDYVSEKAIFERTFSVIAEKLGEEAFVKHKNNRAIGGLAPAYYDAVTMGLLPHLNRLELVDPSTATQILNDAIGHENDSFRDNVGPGANASPRLSARISEVSRIFDQQLPAVAA